MPTDVVMPQMGESIFEGAITKWLKKPGDRVEKDEPLFEISTDKVDAEIPAPVAGVLTEIKVQEGATVEVNTVVAVISESGAVASVPAAEMEMAVVTQAAQTASMPAQLATPRLSGQRQRSSPLVRRIAKENDLDLSRIAGSGSEGRITKEDVMRHLAQNGSCSAEAAPQPMTQPMTRMRAIIAERMLESVQISPHVHTVYKIDMTRIARLREREKARFEQQHGVKLTYMPFIATAAAEALVKFPIVNASLIDGSIHYHRDVNLGIAVALEWGLIVPVVRQAEALSFVSLARAIADLAGRARTKKLLPDEIQGGTFTLTNSGVFGGEFGTPIINQPESAILAIGGLRKEPVVLTDDEENDTIAIRSVQYFCLGFDHRLIDGAEAGKFMSEFKRVLEGWEKPVG
jgi:2-oxoglutarate dehydrogenase E2 component (dihydrolipoamide succinyltransferase)